MKKQYSISMYLDTRRAKSNGKYPLKLRVFTTNPKKQKLYSTSFDFTEKEFGSICLTTKPRKEFKEIRLQVQSVENRANEVAGKIVPFTFNQFEKKLYRKKNDGIKVQYHYEEKILEYSKYNRISTATSYTYSEKAIQSYIEKAKNKKYEQLTLLDIDKDWLMEFESYMKNTGNSITTIGIYLRSLRAVFNKAIEEGEIEKELYPFGKRKYQIPSSTKVKKALSKKQMKKLFGAIPANKHQEKAKDFWFFSFNCNGMNIKDIAHLKFKDIQEDKIIFYRAKTLFTSKTAMKQITVYKNSFIEKVINKYGARERSANNYIFDILEEGLTPKEQQVKVQNFTRLINQHLKKLCEANDLPKEISTYWARHSFATLSVQKGATMEFIQESLGHKNMATTQAYFAGFDDDTKKRFADNLMDFD